MESRSFIGLGSNLDDRLGYINKALELLNANEECEVVKVSSMYESKPYGYTEQNNFLNCVAEISTTMNLNDLLKATKEIERQIGRKEREKWGPREVDLDILFFNDMIYSDDKLTVPHRDVINRDFVLVPLCEIAPEFVHPGEKKRVCDLNKDTLEKNIISKLEFNFI